MVSRDWQESARLADEELKRARSVSITRSDRPHGNSGNSRLLGDDRFLAPASADRNQRRRKANSEGCREELNGCHCNSDKNAKHTLRAMKENALQGFWNGSLLPISDRVVAGQPRVSIRRAIDSRIFSPGLTSSSFRTSSPSTLISWVTSRAFFCARLGKTGGFSSRLQGLDLDRSILSLSLYSPSTQISGLTSPDVCSPVQSQARLYPMRSRGFTMYLSCVVRR